MYEYSVEFYGNFFLRQFCGKTDSFCTSHSNIFTSLAPRRFSDGFRSITDRNGFKLRLLTTTQMLSIERLVNKYYFWKVIRKL